jgi:FtsH-binding integral membrane protein
MKTYQANMLNVLTLIAMSLWAYFAHEPTPDKMSPSPTIFIPLVFGVILLLCHNGVKKENKIIAHVAVLVTLLSVIGLVIKPLMSALDEDRFIAVFRVGAMILTGVIAMITFIQSFIRNRRQKKL